MAWPTSNKYEGIKTALRPTSGLVCKKCGKNFTKIPSLDPKMNPETPVPGTGNIPSPFKPVLPKP